MNVQEKAPLSLYDITYDEIIHLLEEIESDEIEQKYSHENLEKIAYFIASLADDIEKDEIKKILVKIPGVSTGTSDGDET